MQTRTFQPGFRLSALDVGVLIGAAIGVPLLWSMTWWWGFVVAFVLAHFFLFCNVLRAARRLELAWAGVFVTLAGATIALDVPGWPGTVAGSLGMSVVVVVLEMRKPSYHGAFWQTINPHLPAWWQAQIESDAPAPQSR